MAVSQYLYRRPSGIYFVRLVVPSRLRAAVGKGEMHRTTGCRDLRLAKIVAAEIAAEWHRALEKLKHMDPKKIAAGSLDLLGEGLIPVDRAASALGTTPDRLVDELTARGSPVFVKAEGWRGWVLDDIQELDHEYDERGLVSVDLTNLAQKGRQELVTRDLVIRFPEEAVAVACSPEPVPVCQFMWSTRGRFAFVVDLPGQPLTSAQLQVRKADVEEFRQALAPRAVQQLESQACFPRDMARAGPVSPGYRDMRLSTLVERFMQAKGGDWKADTRRTYEERLGALVELTDDAQLVEVDREFLLNFAQTLSRVPNDRPKVKARFQAPQAGFKDLIRLADEHNLPRLTANAQIRHLDAASALFAWATVRDYFERDPAKELSSDVVSLDRRTSARAARSHFTEADLQLIFSARWFATGTGERTPQGIFYSYRPHYYWLPLLGLFSGARLNELSQLYLSDIRKEKGVAFLDFNLEGEDKIDADGGGRDGAAGDKSLKTENAIRRVPIHPRLISLGFLDYVAALENAGHKRLFPELKHDRIKGYGKAAGKWFNDRFLGTELKMERDGRRTFHSFRHTFTTACGDSEMPGNVRAELLGHSKGTSEGDKRYDKGRTLPILSDHLSRVAFNLPPIAPFNVVDGLQAVRDGLRYKRRSSKA